MACPESGQRPSTHNWQGRADSVSDASAPGSSLGLRHTPERPGSQTGGRALPPRGPRCGCRRYRQASRLQAIFRFRTPGIDPLVQASQLPKTKMGGFLNLAEQVLTTPGLGGLVCARRRAHDSGSGQGKSHFAGDRDMKSQQQCWLSLLNACGAPGILLTLYRLFFTKTQ